MTDRGWALVTGGARRLGQVLALTAAEAGYHVLVHARERESAEETAALVRERGRHAATVAGNLEDPRTAIRLISAAPGRLSLLINNASRFDSDTIHTLSAEAIDAAHATNLRAPVLLAQAFARALPADAPGQIVNMVDQRVWRLNPHYFSYTLSKAALWAATQTLAQALAPRIRVNAIGPGPTLSSVHQDAATFASEAANVPLERAVDPLEIGQALRYLLDAGSVTGQMIAVDGGQHLGWRTPDVDHG